MQEAQSRKEEPGDPILSGMQKVIMRIKKVVNIMSAPLRVKNNSLA